METAPEVSAPASAPAPTPARATRIPRHRGLPWLGAPRRILSHPGRYLLEGYHALGPVFRFQLFGMEMVALIGPEANRAVMTTHRDKLSHAEGYKIVRDVLGDGLLFQDGEVHRRNRTLMMPAFHQLGVQRYFEVMHEVAREHLEGWARAGRSLALERFRDLTFEIMARLVLGVDSGLDLARLRQLSDDLARGAIFFPRVDVPFTPYGKALRALDELKRHLRGVIRERRAHPGADALGLLISARDESGAALSEDELVEQCVILTFAGHETTASMLTSWALALRDQPQVALRLRTEQRAVRGEAELSLAHLEQLTFLDATLKEVERMWPPISLCQRGVLEPFDFHGFRLEPGMTVSYSPWASHRIAGVFADPDRFDPERFLAPRREHRAAPHAPYALVGFGGGARLCIGQAFALLEAKIVASLLLAEFALIVEPGDPLLKYVPTLHPESGLPAFLQRGAADS